MKDYAVYDELLSHVNIADVISRYISVEKKGQNYQALCPFHDDRNPSLMISPTKGIFNCFVCNTGGNAIRFIQLYEKKNYFEAAQKLAELVNFNHDYFSKTHVTKTVDTARLPLQKAISDLKAYYQYTLLTNEGQAGKDYLVERGITDHDFQKYEIGFAPRNGRETINFLKSKGHSLKTLEDIGVASGALETSYDRNEGRVIFPLHNRHGEVVGFSARAMPGTEGSKYVNSPETKLFVKSQVLYNYHHAKNILNAQYVYLVEGFLDVIALDKAGILSAVGLMGTAFTKEQVALLKLLKREVRIYLDSDNAGQMATLGVIKELTRARINYQIVAPHPQGLDPDDVLKKEGKEQLIKHANTFIAREDFIFNYYARTSDKKDINANRKFVEEVMNEVIVGLKSRLEVSAFIERLSTESGFNAIVLHDMYEKRMKSSVAESAAVQAINSKLPLKQTLNKISQAERFVLYQMLHFPEARDFFSEHIKVFSNEIHRYLASYLREMPEDNDLSYAEIINDINVRFTDEVKINAYTNEVLTIEEEARNVNYDPEILNDALNTLQYERELKLLDKTHQETLLYAQDDLAYAAEKSRFISEKRKLKQKYERK